MFLGRKNKQIVTLKSVLQIINLNELARRIIDTESNLEDMLGSAMSRFKDMKLIGLIVIQAFKIAKFKHIINNKKVKQYKVRSMIIITMVIDTIVKKDEIYVLSYKL